MGSNSEKWKVNEMGKSRLEKFFFFFLEMQDYRKLMKSSLLLNVTIRRASSLGTGKRYFKIFWVYTTKKKKRNVSTKFGHSSFFKFTLCPSFVVKLLKMRCGNCCGTASRWPMSCLVTTFSKLEMCSGYSKRIGLLEWTKIIKNKKYQT